MCGIAGFISKDIDREKTIKAMTDSIIHRGPDAYGRFMDESSGLTFGHRRLSIIDITETGSQPMVSASGRYVICYNGEIYDAHILKNMMESEGHHIDYRGTSDTEILLESLEYYGITKTLSMVKGMFAVALFDKKDKCLYLFRDRVGEKSVYYSLVNGHFVFASEIQAITAYEGFNKEINKEVLPLFLTRGYIAAPYSIYEGVYKLLPGQILTLKGVDKDLHSEEDLELSSYYDIRKIAVEKEDSFKGSFDEAVEELDRLMTAAVKGQMVADVPLGAFLSGGIDSASVVALMNKVNLGNVKSFTIGFEDKKYNEADFARDIAKHIGTDHTELVVSDKELTDVIPIISDIYGEPFGDSSQIPTYLVSKLARSKVTVSLSGDAGDELFCGYRTYDKVLPFWNKTGKLPGFVKGAGSGLCSLFASTKGSMYRASMCLKAKNVVEMKNYLACTSAYLDKLSGTKPKVSGQMLLKGQMNSMMLDDLTLYHTDDILVKVDRAGMRVSLENRIPMLDRDVLEFALSLPISYKFENGVQKRVLKEMLYRYVPKELMDRPKTGFAVPLRRWLTSGTTGDWAASLMNDLTFAKDGFLNESACKGLWQGFLKGKEPAELVWYVLMLEQWYQNQYKKLSS